MARRKTSGRKRKKKTYRRKKRGLSSILKLTKKQKTFLKGILIGALVVLAIIYDRRIWNISRFSEVSREYESKGDVGIDISHYQGRVDWSNLKLRDSEAAKHSGSSVAFVIAKATEGTKTADKTYASNKSRASKSGVLFGAYHFFYPNASPSLQAAFFIKKASLSAGNILPVLDVEQHGRLSVSELQKRVLKWLEIVEAYYGKPPIIYCNQSYYTKYFSGPRFRRYGFWIASYSRRPQSLHNVILWQYTDRGRVNGIKSKVDMDLYLGKDDDFKSIIL